MKTTEGPGRRLCLPPAKGCNGGGRFVGGGDLRPSPSEYSGVIYCDLEQYGPVSGIEADARDKGDNAVVEKVGSGFRGDTDGGPGGKADGGIERNILDGDCCGRLFK